MTQANNSQDPVQNALPKPEWAELIVQKRKQLKENQTQFGQRFGVSYAAVSEWELGKSDPPGEVTWWIMYGEHLHGTEV